MELNKKAVLNVLKTAFDGYISMINDGSDDVPGGGNGARGDGNDVQADDGSAGE